MNLKLIHGRFDPAEEMQDWGFNGPVIAHVECLHVTYQATFAVWFETVEACEAAQALTGWRDWDDKALEMVFHQDLLKAVATVCDGPVAYYGDWELEAFAR